MEWPKVFVAQTEINIKFAGELPGILQIQIEGVHPDKAFRISNSDRGG